MTPPPSTGSAAARCCSRRPRLGLTAVPAGRATAAVTAPAGPIVKPLPPELFTVHGTNAETRWEALRGTGYHTPVDRFFVRNHTSTPAIDLRDWRLRLHGTGLRHAPTAGAPLELTYADLRRLPSHEISAAIECAGNGRSFFTTQQGQTVSGTAWKLGAVGVARWRGVRLSTVLRRAGITPAAAVDVMPVGLDDDFVSGGVNHGRVRRPMPVAKALDDVLLAYEMNGEPLPPDHGFPVRVVVPGWIGIASIKWVGGIEVSAEPLASPWDTAFYRLFGPRLPARGQRAAHPAGREERLRAALAGHARGRAPARPHRTVLVGQPRDPAGRGQRGRRRAPGAARSRPARPAPPAGSAGRCRGGRRPDRTSCWPGRPTARGATQPDVAPYNTLGYLFGAVVRHPVTVA